MRMHCNRLVGKINVQTLTNRGNYRGKLLNGAFDFRHLFLTRIPTRTTF